MTLFKSKNGKTNKTDSTKKEEVTTEDVTQNNTVEDTNNDNNTKDTTMNNGLTTFDNITQESLKEEPNELSNLEENIICDSTNKNIISNEYMDGHINNIPSMTSLDTSTSRITDKTHGTVTFNSNSSSENVEENSEKVLNVPKLNNSHKRNSIFRSFSKMRRRSKVSEEDKKYKSDPHLSEDINSAGLRANSVKLAKKSSSEIEDIDIKRYKSVPNNKSPIKYSFSSKKKRKSSLNINTTTKIDPIKKGPYTISCDFPVKETNTMVRDYDPKTGRKMINNYVVVKEVGRGCHGKVKLCYDINTNEQYAMKIVNKKIRRRFYYRMALSHQQDAANPHMEKIKREIAILKKCSHPHVVRLKEVIDCPESEKIYIILEYLDGGEVKWQISPEEPKPVMSQNVARKVFRDVISGVGYLHHQGIVHRDIKPANLLWTSDGHVKISDFGVSCFMNTDNPNLSAQERRNNELELAKTAGSPAFFAPELCGINDEEISNTITQFAALLNSRTSNKSQSGFPHTPSNISSYSKLDAIFAPRSIHTPSIMSRVSDGSLNKANNETKSINSQCDKSLTDINSAIINNNNLAKDKSSYSSLRHQPSSSNERLDIINVNEKQSSSSSINNNSDLKPQKPRSIKWVNNPTKRSFSLSESTTNGNNATNATSATNSTNVDIASKSVQEEKSNITNNTVLNKSFSNRTRSNSASHSHLSQQSHHSHYFSSNESLNRRKIPEANGHYGSEQKMIYSSSYSTLENNRLKVDDDFRHHALKVPSKSSLSINNNNRSNESLDVNVPFSSIDVEKMIPPESPLFIRRRCSQSSSKSNVISRSQSALSSSSRPKFTIERKASLSLPDKSPSKSLLRVKKSCSSSISEHFDKNKEEVQEKTENTVPKRPTPHIDGKLIDIWAMGVTLYCLIFGDVPFTASTEFELLSVICHQELKFPEDIPISDSLRDLLTKILTKDPKKRIGMKEIENHPWVTEDLTKEERKEWLEFVSLNDDPLDVTEDEVKKALTLKERIKKGFSKFTHSLTFLTGEFRRRTKSMPSVKVDKELFKQNKDKFNNNNVADNTICESNDTINKSNTVNGSVQNISHPSLSRFAHVNSFSHNPSFNSMGRNSSSSRNISFSSLGRMNNNSRSYSNTMNNGGSHPNSNSNLIHHSRMNSQEVKIIHHPEFDLNIHSPSNSISLPNNNSNNNINNINMIQGLERQNTATSETREPNVRNSQIYIIPKTFLNKDYDSSKNINNNEEEEEEEEEEAGINEDSNSEILYISFDRKPKKENSHKTLDNDGGGDDNNDKD